MKAVEIMEELFSLVTDRDCSNSCDTCKAGNPDVEVNKIAVAMVATPEVIKSATKWGAQLLIVHEPTYYNHNDEHSDEKIENEKRKLIEESGLTIYRYHDHPHYTFPDVISQGEVLQMGLEGTVEYPGTFDLVRIRMDKPVTPRELAKIIEERCNIKHIRVCGAMDAPCTKISGMFGAPGGFNELKSDECEVLLIGEVCEWQVCEYARDAAQMGYKKAVLIMGHVGSERDGMKYTAELLKDKHPEVEVKYFECGEVYSYV